MAMSEDTIALVAAQLTVAWAMRAESEDPDKAIAEVAQTFLRIRRQAKTAAEREAEREASENS